MSFSPIGVCSLVGLRSEFFKMKEIKVDVAIVGAGTAGLSAVREVQKYSERFVLIDGGQLGTTCARVGCMPSKVFIQSANDFYRRHSFKELGISGAGQISVSIPEVMKRVRRLRDGFVSGVLKNVEALGDKFIPGFARFEEPTSLVVEGFGKVHAKAVVLACGSRPHILKAWEGRRNIWTTDDFFELEDLPKKVGVLGVGVIGLELGQAMARLGVEVQAVHGNKAVGGLSDPEVQAVATELFQQDFALQTDKLANLKFDGESPEVEGVGPVDGVLASIGRRSNLDRLDFDKLDIALDDRGYPDFDPTTTRLKTGEPIYIAGDVNGDRAILHEAADEGRMAGFNATQESDKCFRRRAGLRICFSDPNTYVVGKSFAELDDADFSIGEVRFENQGRSKIALKNRGILRVYADPDSGRVLGAEGCSPDGEHLAHLLAFGVQKNLNVDEFLNLPFYHPVVEEGLRTAIRSLTSKVSSKRPELELPPCEELPVSSFN